MSVGAYASTVSAIDPNTGQVIELPIDQAGAYIMQDSSGVLTSAQLQGSIQAGKSLLKPELAQHLNQHPGYKSAVGRGGFTLAAGDPRWTNVNTPRSNRNITRKPLPSGPGHMPAVSMGMSQSPALAPTASGLLSLGTRYTPSSASAFGSSGTVPGGATGTIVAPAGAGLVSTAVGGLGSDRDPNYRLAAAIAGTGGRGRPRGRRPLRGQFPVVPIDMVRQLGIEQQVILQPAAPVAMRNKAVLCRPLSMSRKTQASVVQYEGVGPDSGLAVQTEDLDEFSEHRLPRPKETKSKQDSAFHVDEDDVDLDSQKPAASVDSSPVKRRLTIDAETSTMMGYSIDTDSQTEELEAAQPTPEPLAVGKTRFVPIPIPVPIYVPIPICLYARPVPYILPFPLPCPIPLPLIMASNKSDDEVNELLEESDVSAFPTTVAEESDVPAFPTTVAEESDVSAFPATAVEESDVSAFPVTTVGDTDVSAFPATTVEESDVSAFPATTVEESDVSNFPTTAVEEPDVSPSPAAAVEEKDSSASPYSDVDLDSEAELPQASEDSNSLVIATEPVGVEPSEQLSEVVSQGTERPLKRPSPSSSPEQESSGSTASPSQPSVVEASEVERTAPESHVTQARFDSTTAPSEPLPPAAKRPRQTLVISDANYHLKFSYGINAWRHWVQHKLASVGGINSTVVHQQYPYLHTELINMSEEDLNLALSQFVREVRKPNNECYVADSIFYLCLGIQEYLNENGCTVNLFGGPKFSDFSDALDNILANFQPRISPEGLLICRIEEEHLWEARQLGAQSPEVLLFTMLYFNTKHFGLRLGVAHRQLCLAHFHVTDDEPPDTAIMCQLPDSVFGGAADGTTTTLRLEMNMDYPERCPVQLFKNYLAKCPPSMRMSHDVFYLLPVYPPDGSAIWYSTTAMEPAELQVILNRIKMVKEIQEAFMNGQPEGGF